MSYNLSFPTLSTAPPAQARPILGRNFSNTSTPASYFNNNDELFVDDYRRLSINGDTEIPAPKTIISPNLWSPANFHGQKSIYSPVNIPLSQNFQESSIAPNFYPPNKYNQEKRPYHIKKQDECVFCKNNNLSPAEYKGHLVKDPRTKKVTCPVLRNMPCRRCHASGDFAHTDRYCPAKPPIVRIFNVQK